MSLGHFGVRAGRALFFEFVSKAVSAFVLISILTVSIPAAPRAMADAVMIVSQIEIPAPSLPTLDASSLPTIAVAPLAAIYHNSIALGGRIQAVVLPTLPAGLENAKLPSLNERMFGFFAPIFAFLTSTSKVATTATNPAPPPQPTSVVDFDFDNDGKADIGRWRVANTEFQIRNSNGGSYSSFALTSAAKIAPGDFNGDGKTDAAVFNNGTWTYKTSASATAQTISFGATGDIPVAGDYDGDGTTDAAVYRPSTNTWWIRKSSGGTTSTTFGSANDITVPGDYDGDGKNDLALFRPSTGDWHVTGSTAGYFTLHWGLGTDTPVPADFDGDGKTDPAVFRPSTGTWYVYRSDGQPLYQQAWGNYRDQPVPADYDGDGKADFAIWRPTTGIWYILKSSDQGYESYALGTAGDTAVPSAYLKQVGGEVTGDALNAARMSPRNATGGTDLYSQNFGWSRSLVDLPGRAGLDANLGISYNSLVWTKVGSSVVFDADYSNASPGFRLGLPTIEPIYYDTDKGKNTWAYMMVTPSGGRVQFRQTSVTNVYETADSNYAQLIVNGATSPNDPSENLWLLVRTTDGTQMTYNWSSGGYRCTQVKDRNGNYISLVYNGQGDLTTITDTLGRVITVGYDPATGLPTSINFPRYAGNGNGSLAPGAWVTFSYTDLTINTTFDSSLTVIGPPNGTVVKVLDRITYADGSTTRFSYNGFAQVSKVETYAPNGGFLNYVAADHAQSPSSEVPPSTLEVPRLAQTRTKIKDFNGENEVTVNNELRFGHQFVDIDGATVTGNLIQVQVLGHPTGNITNTYIGSSGWTEGLPMRVDDWANGSGGLEVKRSSFTRWTQDNTSVNYQVNPRVIESRVSDGVNTKKTAIEYHPVGGSIPHSGLVKKVEIGDLSTVYKRIETTYQLDPAYVSRRIIGLPLEVKTWGKNDLIGSPREDETQVTYAYDGENFSLETNQIVTPSRHDAVYDSTFIVGRGNLTSTTRHDVTGTTAAFVSKTRYDIAGSPVAQIDPMNRKVAIGYGDNFNTSVSPATFAYPTTITDPAGNSSTVQYRFDFGSNIEANSPAPAGNAYGKRTTRSFDEKGRLLKDSIWRYTAGAWVENSYKRFDYTVTNGLQHQVYSTLVDQNGNNAADAADEVLTEVWTDGAGRVKKSRMPHTWNGGGTLTWAGTETKYDILGRVTSQSVPTELNSTWQPTGDDASRTDYLWTHQEYDWMGRVTRKVNTDGSLASTNASDVIISYSACGCAGGLETTIEGEEVIEKNWDGTTSTSLGRRKQKIYQDVLGRTKKSEIFNWNNSVYSTAETKFNGRDQAVTVTKTEASTSISQVTTTTFDGHGRLKTRHLPQQDSGVATTYNYNSDDTIASVVDGRNAATVYSYNSRGLVEEIEYTVPTGSSIPSTPAVTFGFDNAGNRVSMTRDGLGTVSYEYNSLSQLTAETSDFTDDLASAPNGVFRLEYSYTLGGQLKSVKDPYGDVVNYAHDKVSRLSTVTGSSFAGVTSYVSSPHYRAWGAVQSLSYSNNTVVSSTFDDRLRADHSQLVKNGTTTLMSKNYGFYADGALRKTDDLMNDKFDRTMTYDHVGRPVTAKSAAEARGTTVTVNQDVDLPYRQSYDFDAFGHLTQRDNLQWGRSSYGASFNLSYTYSNDRVTNTGWEQDADGRVTKAAAPDHPTTSTYNAAGELVKLRRDTRLWAPGSEVQRFYDGDGNEVKRIESDCSSASSQYPCNPPTDGTETRYFIRSSVLSGRVITEAFSDGKKKKTQVLAGETSIAVQSKGENGDEAIYFQYADPSGMSHRTANTSGTLLTRSDAEGQPAELDGLGGNVGLSDIYATPRPTRTDADPSTTLRNLFDGEPNYVNGQQLTTTLDGMDIPNSMAFSLIARGAVNITYSPPVGFSLPQFGILHIPGHKVDGPQPDQEDPGSEHYQVNNYTTPDMYIAYGDDAAEFFRRFPRCYNVFQKVLGNRFWGFMRSLANMDFVDVRERNDLLDKTLTELEIPAIADDGTFGEASGTLRELGTGAMAVTSPDNNVAYLFKTFPFDGTPTQRGGIKIHEQLHKFLRANHKSLLRRFGLEVPPAKSEALNGIENVDIVTGKVIQKIPPIAWDSTEDEEAGHALDRFLEAGCVEVRR